jgi:hypothetical protein
MSNSHNKKRNVGIIYEQLLTKASAALVDNDFQTAQECSRIIKTYYKPGTEVFKEHRLFQALLNTTVKSENVGLRIMQEAKRGSNMFSTRQLEIEKSQLIKEINKSIDDRNFFNQHVKNYRLYATVQTLMNDWRKEDEGSLGRVIQYEQKLLEWLESDKTEAPVLSELKNEKVTPLAVKIMNEKFEKKWAGKLTELQHQLIRDYVHGKVDISMLESIKARTSRGLRRLKESTDSQVLLEKIDYVFKIVEGADVTKLDDAGIVKFMQLTQLQQELEAKDE